MDNWSNGRKIVLKGINTPKLLHSDTPSLYYSNTPIQ